MPRIKKQFNRWGSTLPSTWAFQVFNKYNDELNEMVWANLAASSFVYAGLKDKGALWTDKAASHLKFEVPSGEESFEDLKDWSTSYNQFQNWTNLNTLMAISANFETYLATVAQLALESDPGIMFESSKSIDGVLFLKRGTYNNIFKDQIIISLTKGDWNSRVSAFERYFGNTPPALQTLKGELEKIRVLRNKIGHAFGRDIAESRNHEVKQILTMENLTVKSLKKYQRVIWSTAKNVDKYLLGNHIGEFQAISFYHRIFPTLRHDLHQSMRAVSFKKQLGGFGDLVGKDFCKGLVKYYEEI